VLARRAKACEHNAFKDSDTGAGRRHVRTLTKAGRKLAAKSPSDKGKFDEPIDEPS